MAYFRSVYTHGRPCV